MIIHLILILIILIFDLNSISSFEFLKTGPFYFILQLPSRIELKIYNIGRKTFFAFKLVINRAI